MTESPAKARPRSTERFEARSSEILDKVRLVFMANGLEKTSMQQLAQAADMSAGNFYRYFPSKDAIIEALIERDLAMLETEFAQIRDAENPTGMFRALVTQRVRNDDCNAGPMLIEIEAPALHRPAIARAARRVDRAIQINLTNLFAQLTDCTVEGAHERWHGQAQLIAVIVKGVMRATRQAQLAGETEHLETLCQCALHAVDQTLNQVIESGKNLSEKKQ